MADAYERLAEQEAEFEEYVNPQEVAMAVLLQRQTEALARQEQSMSLFSKLEAGLANKLVLSDLFSKQVQEYPHWELANFHVASSGSELQAQLQGEWLPAVISATMLGLQLRYYALRSRQPLRLKSLACEIKLSVRLFGDSSLWLFTRGAGVNDPDALVSIISKEQESDRVFILLGGNLGPHGEFMFIKKHQLPNLSGSSANRYGEDCIDLKLTVVDNGDTKAFVTVSAGVTRVLTMSYNKCVPSLNDYPLILAGSGNSVLLKNISIRQVERTAALASRSDCECCKLF